ncbi:MAG: SagB family peptide dehydrogenase, partial [Acidobacteriota bacterium]
AAQIEFDYQKKAQTAELDAEQFLARHGEPPSAEFEVAGQQDSGDIDLPRLGREKGQLSHLLSARKTVRSFSDRHKVSLEQFSQVVHQTFMVIGTERLGSRLVLNRKTSPSGGSLHPIEAFPVVRSVEGLQPGIYHYRCVAGKLRPLQFLKSEEVRKIATKFGQGQKHAGDAHFTVVLVARFERSFWKYRNRANAYNVLMTDVGGLVQTCYLTCQSVGLGCFYTGAVEPILINEVLNFDDYRVGAIGLIGCGVEESKLLESDTNATAPAAGTTYTCT